MRTTDTPRPAPARPRPVARFNSLIAAAEIVRAPRAELRKALGLRMSEWITEAWSFYDTVGELGFGVGWIGNAMSRVNLVAAVAPRMAGDEPTPILLPSDEEAANLPPEDVPTPVQRRAAEVVAGIAGGASGQGQMLNGFGIHLSVAGIGWLVAEPDPEDPESDEYVTWTVYSSAELRSKPGTNPEDDDAVQVAAGESEWRDLHKNAWVQKVWRKHPNKSWLPDAPTRRCLGVLREIDGYQKHKHATIMSRLAGAGLLIMPNEVTFPRATSTQVATVADGIDPDDAVEVVETNPQQEFAQELTEYIVTPIGDRGSAGAVSPFIAFVPGEWVDKVRYITFSTPFDDRVEALLDQAVKRLALGLDMPPEVLTGVADVNHWTAWQVEETALTLHVEPTAEIVCHALSQFLATVLRAEGFSPEEIASVMAWYDTTDLRTRPDRSVQSTEAYDRLELSGAAYLRELGLSEEDRPDEEEWMRRILVRMMNTPIPELVPVILTWLAAKLGTPLPALPEVSQGTPGQPPGEAPEGPGGPQTGPPEPPTTEPEPEEPPAEQAALLAACDGIVYAALTRAGNVLRSAAGRRNGGAAAVDCDDPALLHTKLDATSHATLTSLLMGAWRRVPDVAARFDYDPDRLTATLDAYTRSLLASRSPHSYDRLADALGITASV